MDQGIGEDLLIAFVADGVDEILRHQKSKRFFQWLEGDAIQRHDALLELLEAAGPALLRVLGQALWNLTPLPRRDFTPEVLESPALISPCPCGSGLRFRECCDHLPTLDSVLDPNLIWYLVIERLNASGLVRLARSGQAPRGCVGYLGDRLLEVGRPRVALGLLEPRFERPAEATEEDEHTLLVLFDAYAALKYHRKREREYRRLADELPSGLRVALMRERIAELADKSEPEAAWETLIEASQGAPEDQRLAPLEVLLVLGRDGVERSVERARFWCHRLRRRGLDPHEEAFEFLLLASEDPLLALAPTLGLSIEHGRRLRQLFARFERREVAPVADSYLLAGDGEHQWLVTDPYLEDLETRWHGLFPLTKPNGRDAEPRDPTSAWDIDTAEAWLSFLEAHPDLADSFDVLDDLVLALQQLTARRAGFEHLHRDLLYAPVARATRLHHALLKAKGPFELSWGTVQNQACLRVVGG